LKTKYPHPALSSAPKAQGIGRRYSRCTNPLANLLLWGILPNLIMISRLSFKGKFNQNYSILQRHRQKPFGRHFLAKLKKKKKKKKKILTSSASSKN